MTSSYSHRVLNNNKVGSKPVEELTTGLKFESIKQAVRHFKISENVIAKSANGRAKKPQHPYKFRWITLSSN
jgi:hypothetical protein